jgi:hypothetical protein
LPGLCDNAEPAAFFAAGLALGFRMVLEAADAAAFPVTFLLLGFRAIDILLISYLIIYAGTGVPY